MAKKNQTMETCVKEVKTNLGKINHVLFEKFMSNIFSFKYGYFDWKQTFLDGSTISHQTVSLRQLLLMVFIDVNGGGWGGGRTLGK